MFQQSSDLKIKVYEIVRQIDYTTEIHAAFSVSNPPLYLQKLEKCQFEYLQF